MHKVIKTIDSRVARSPNLIATLISKLGWTFGYKGQTLPYIVIINLDKFSFKKVLFY